MVISGIQQIGIGIPNVHEAFDFYRKTFAMDVKVFEEAATAALMLPYTGGQPRDRHAILALNSSGGGGMEIWQYTSRVPQPANFTVKLGDLGLAICKMKCKNAETAFHYLRKKDGLIMLGGIEQDLAGRPHFFVRDPWGNIFEYVQTTEFFNEKSSNPLTGGGVFGAIIGVTDIEKSREFYEKILGYDSILGKSVGKMRDFAPLDGGFDEFERILLKHSQPRSGPFSALLGTSEVELVAVKNRIPRRIFEDRLWGDLGFIHLCFDVVGMDKMAEKCAAFGTPFTVDSGKNTFDMGEAAGRFSYIEDPDGALIEFVETHKVPILKKIGWFLNLKKRSNVEKSLPNWMIRALCYFERVKD
jgi:catechol 2,3-dioxygenase-like lactoylglutathione lyase family enzyme